MFSFAGFLSCHAEHFRDSVGAGGLHYRGVIRRCSNLRGQGVGGVHFSYPVPNFPIFSPSRGGFRGVGDAEVVKLNFQAVVSNFRPAVDEVTQFSAPGCTVIWISEVRWDVVQMRWPWVVLKFSNFHIGAELHVPIGGCSLGVDGRGVHVRSMGGTSDFRRGGWLGSVGDGGGGQIGAAEHCGGRWWWLLSS